MATKRVTKADLEERVRNLEAELEAVRHNPYPPAERPFFSDLLRNSSMIMLLIDPETGALVDANPAAEVFYGYSREQFLGLNIRQINTLTPEEIRKKMGLAIARAENVFHFRHRLASGDVRDVAVTSGPVVQNGKTFLYSIVHDETEVRLAREAELAARTRAEQDLRSHTHFLQTLIDTASTPIFYKDRQGVYRGCNNAFAELFGLSPDAVIGKTVFDVAPEDLARTYQQADDELLAKGGAQTYETLVQRHDGTRRMVLFQKSTYTGPDGEAAGIIGIMVDITGRIEAEQAVRKSEERFHGLFDSSPIPFWEHDMSRIRDYADVLRRELGVTSLQAWLHAHPEAAREFLNRDRVVSVNQAAVAMHRATDKESLMNGLDQIFVPETVPAYAESIASLLDGQELNRMENVLRTLDGECRDVVVRWAVAPGCEQTLERVWISVVDITHRKQIEQALEESEKQYRTLFDSAGDAIFILDLQGRFIQVNKTACEWLGYERGELLAMGVADINAPDARKSIPELFALLSQTEELIFETRHITREGHELPMEINARLIDFQGQPAILSMARDVSERKLAEKEILDREAQLNAILENAPDIVFLKSITGRYLFVNKAFEDLAGAANRHVAGLTDSELFGSHAASLMEHDALVLECGCPQVFEEEYFSKGQTHTFRVVRFPIKNTDGETYAICGMGADITERLRDRALREMNARILGRLNRLTGQAADIEDVLRIIQNVTGVEALALRLQHGVDYEYFATVGFDAAFVEKEHSLCAASHEDGRHASCEPECLCGFVAQGRTPYSDLPGVTPHGTLWTNSLKNFVDTAQPRDLPERLRLTCLYQGYESVALIPLKAQDQVIGLLQMNDRRPDMFSNQLIGVFEEIAGSIAIAVSRFKAEQALRQSREALALRNDIAFTFLTTPDDEIFDQVLQTILAATHSAIGVFGYIDENGVYVCPTLSRGVWETCDMDEKKLAFPPCDWGGIWGRALIGKQSFCINEPFAVPDGHLPVLRALDVPVIFQERVVGNFLVANKESDYDVYDIDLLQAIADYFAPVLHFRLQSLEQERERRRAEQALEWELETTAAIVDLSQSILSLDSFDDICARVLDIAKKLTGSRHGFVGYMDPQTRHLVCPTMTRDVWVECEVPDRTIIFKKFTGLWGWVLNHREPVITNEPQLDERSGGTPAGHIPIENFLSVPSLFGEELLGQIALANTPGGFEQRHLDALQRVAGYFAIAVQKERARRALMESEERFRTISVAAQDAIVMMDAQGRITFWNPAAVKLFGYSVEQALGRDLHGIISPGQYQDAAKRGLKGFSDTGQGSVIGHVLEVQAVHNSGRQFSVELSISSIRVSGQWHAVGIMRDITERKQAEEELRRHRDHLEELVRLRTRELIAANEQLHDLSRTIITLQEEERARLSRELHDQLGQQLTALTLELEWVRESMSEGGQHLKPLTGMVSDMATEVRRICKGLRPMILDRMGLASAITAHINEFREHTDLDVRLDVDPMDDLEVDATTSISVFRIMQEALNNAAKYSRAQRVDVAFHRQPGELVLCVVDDGIGIDQDQRRHQGLGLAGMRERAALCGGRIAIVSAPGHGTKIEMRVPISGSHEASEQDKNS